MLKNKKGYLLTETIIAITIIATIITVIYALAMSNYSNQNNSVMRYNTTDGLYIAKEVEKLFEESQSENIASVNAAPNHYINMTSSKKQVIESLGIKKLYFSIYDMTDLLQNEKFPVSISNQLKSLDYDVNKCSYRYLMIFTDNSYSTVGVECN